MDIKMTMEIPWSEFANVALSTGLLIVVMHYWTPRQLHRTVRYTMGVLAIIVPISVVLVNRQFWPALILLWLAAGTAGITTWACYLIESWQQRNARLIASEQEARVLREAAHAQAPK